MKTDDRIKKSLRLHLMPNHPHGCIGCAYRDESKQSTKCITSLYRDTIEYIERLESQVPRWVPVTERLPEDGTTCLITIKEKDWYGKIEHHVDVAYFRDDGGGYIDGRWDTETDWVEGQEICVTHWMPLPSAAKEG